LDGLQQLVIRAQDVHMPRTYLVRANNLGTEGSKTDRTNGQIYTSPLYLAEIPDMGDLNILLGTLDPGKAIKLAHIGGKYIIRIHTDVIDYV
jgi:hypothetical protein